MAAAKSSLCFGINHARKIKQPRASPRDVLRDAPCALPGERDPLPPVSTLKSDIAERSGARDRKTVHGEH